jgi:hypothetical protein
MSFGIGRSHAKRHAGFGAGRHAGADGPQKHRKMKQAHAAQAGDCPPGTGAQGKGGEMGGASKASGLIDGMRAKMKAKRISRTEKRINEVQAQLANASPQKAAFLQQKLQHLMEKYQRLTGQAPQQGPTAVAAGAQPPGAGPSGPAEV